MAFTAQDVKTLREKTGVGMMECKKALTEADGDMDRAFEILRERGLAASEKKASRIAAAGAIIAFTDEDAKVTVLLEINSETDFVGKNEKFQEFGLNVAKTIAANKPASVEALADLALVGSDRTVTENLNDLLSFHHFLNKSLGLCNRALHLHKSLCASSTDRLCNKYHCNTCNTYNVWYSYTCS